METRWPYEPLDRVGIERVSTLRAAEVPEPIEPAGLRTLGAAPDQMLPDFLHPPTLLDRFVSALQSQAVGDDVFGPSEYVQSLGSLRSLMADRLSATADGPGVESLRRAVALLDQELQLHDLLGFMRNTLYRV